MFIPWVLAFQGNNPMSSELASHIGLTGKHFCRACHVAGKDSERESRDGMDPDLVRILDFMQVSSII